MQLSLLSLLGTLSLASSAIITLHLPSAPSLPNPNALPPSTHATLSTLGQPPYSAPLTTANTFVFRNVTSGSYLADVHCKSFAFAPLRVDVAEENGAAVQVWETFRGNAWDNKGEAVREDGLGYEVRVLGQKGYFMERSKCTVPPNPLLPPNYLGLEGTIRVLKSGG